MALPQLTFWYFNKNVSGLLRLSDRVVSNLTLSFVCLFLFLFDMPVQAVVLGHGPGQNPFRDQGSTDGRRSEDAAELQQQNTKEWKVQLQWQQPEQVSLNWDSVSRALMRTRSLLYDGGHELGKGFKAKLSAVVP